MSEPSFQSVSPVAEIARWYASYTSARHEKRVADQLAQRGIEAFLPLYAAMRHWKNGKKLVRFPLFPGYVFVRIALRERLRVLSLPGVVHLVGIEGRPVPIEDEQIAAIRCLLESGTALVPHRFLEAGRRVKLIRGPLQGLEGIIVKRRKQVRFVVSVDLIRRSVAAEVHEADLVPVFAKELA